ncbi:hypothetical protein M1146_02970 [Patescibacteria group bacterium]|nr:hypothetical protein [Patescibacteria group bacterium]
MNDKDTSGQPIVVNTNPSVSTAPISPLGVAQKEQEPIPVVSEPLVSKSDRAPEIHKELAELGVRVTEEAPNLELKTTEKSVQPTPLSVPATPAPLGKGLPITEVQAEQISRQPKSFVDSITWLAKTIVRQFRRAGKVQTQTT